ncbi:PQQ-binding-like beta-propeller repeat protein [Haladaptatus sp. YSMS36]|uniref:outer membrane protein assembly factor BamB family protein n=1 Tax=Haladaptatus sp. YSMS36 TaxID=3033384 RepID=UPI0023E879A3|nr:PQQ-binding-like beta-propeller repeat protein [Haladaptatus sp. YSMS36]
MSRRSRRTFLKGIGITAATGLLGTNALAVAPAGEELDWPVSRGTAGRTGYTTGQGPHPYAAPGWSPGDDLSGDPTEVTVASGTTYIGTVASYDIDESHGEVAAYNATSGGVRWIRSDDSIGAVMAAPTVADGRVFVAAKPAVVYTGGDRQDETPPNGGVMALSAETGETLWTSMEPREPEDAVLVHDGMAYAVSEATIYALDTETGDVQWTAEIATDNSIRAQAASRDALYVATPQTIGAVGVDGTVQWETPMPDGADAASLVATETHLYLTMSDGAAPTTDTVWALAVEDGSVAWETQVAAEFQDSVPNRLSAPAVADGTVYVASDDSTDRAANGPDAPEDNERVGALHALSADSGEERWQFTTAAELRSIPSVSNGTVYVGGTYPTEASVEDEKAMGYFEHGSTYVGSSYARPVVFALNTEDGAEQWSYGVDENADDSYVRTAVPANDHLYVQVTGPGVPPNGEVGSIHALAASDSAPGPEHTLVDDTPYQETAPVEAVITTDPENAENLDFDSGAVVTLSGSESSSPNGEIVSYEWDIDGDGNYEETGESIDVELDYCGILEVTLRVTDETEVTQTTSISLSTV